MIAIDNIPVSDEIVKSNLFATLEMQGACCVDGDAGAPLSKDELDKLNAVHTMGSTPPTPASAELERQGCRYVYDKELAGDPTMESQRF